MALTKALGGGGGGGITQLTGDVTAGPGSGSQAATIANGAVDIAHLSATGTPSSTTFLRGDNTWGTPSGGGAAPITPSSLSNLYRWFKSDTGVTVDGSNNVGTWADQSGVGGGNATQATTANKPLLVSSVLDGYPAIRFTAASSQKLDLSLASLVGSAHTIFMVTGRRSSPGGYCMGAITGGTSNASLHMGWAAASTWAYRFWSNDLDLTVEAYASGRFHIIDMILHTSFGRKTEAYDATMLATTGTTTTLGSIPGGGTIGMAVGTYWDGDIVEIIVYTSALTYSQRAGIRAYLNAKYPSAVSPW